MRCLLDANVLLRLTQPEHVHHRLAAEAVEAIGVRGRCVIVPQALYEFWSVATRPVEFNGLGFKPNDVDQRIRAFVDLFDLLRDERAIYEQWLELVQTHDVKGHRAHDTRYVAAMKRHGLTHILTFNEKDFRRYPDITVLNPTTMCVTSLTA